MADHRRDERNKREKATWGKNKIDASKNANDDNTPKFDKNAYEELMAYAKEIKDKKKL